MNNQFFAGNAVGTAFFILYFVIFIIPAGAATFTVTNTADTNDGTCDSHCTLREAILAANSAATSDVIQFDPAVFSTAQTITLTGTALSINNNGGLEIDGAGADLLAISGNDLSRVFHIESGAIVLISDMTIRNGNGTGGGINGGGGIFSLGNLTLENVIVSNNKVTNTIPNSFAGGGGIENRGLMQIFDSRIEFNETERAPDVNSVGGGGILNTSPGVLLIENSSITNNTAEGNGGGINNNLEATLGIVNSTVSSNAATTDQSGIGGGIINFQTVLAQNLTLVGNTASVFGGGVTSASTTSDFDSRNSIYADNMVGTSAQDFRGTLNSGGFNLIESTTDTTITGDTTGNILNQDPLVKPLGNNGGFSKSHTLAPNSPAIDRGNTFQTTSDQRGFIRPFDNPSIPNAPNSDGADIGALEMQNSEFSSASFDFDGDGKTDIGIFRPSAGEWWYRKSSDEQVFATQFGASSDIIVPADFTGDGKTDIGFFRPSSGDWFVLRSEDSTFFAFPFGTSEDIPAPGDYDGDGKADPAVFRPSNSTWFIQRSSDSGVTIQPFGISEDKPVPADYDGDGKDDIAIFRPSVAEWWMLRSNSGIKAVQFGSTGDKTVQGDYTGDGKADVAFWRPSSGEWFILRSEDDSFFAFPFGLSQDIPAPGDYDGDGKADAAVFRPSNSTWFMQQSSSGFEAVQFGTTGDQPIPNAFVR